MLRRTLFLTFCIAASYSIRAQDAGSDIASVIDEAVEQIVEESDEEVDVQMLTGSLYDMLENPVHINAANIGELTKIPFVNDMLAYQLIRYRETYGALQSLYELQAVSGFSPALIQKISPFITVSAPSSKNTFTLKKAIVSGRKNLFLRYGRTLQHQEGYRDRIDSLILAHPNRIFLGDPNALYLRFTSRYSSRLQYGFTLQKDAGEVWLPSQLSGTIRRQIRDKVNAPFDYYSFHIFLEKIKNIKALALGDYHLQFGQGLLLWSSPAFGKAWNPVEIKRYAQGIKPYKSTDENNFLRGVAGTFQLQKDLQLTIFYSGKHIDANITEADSSLTEETTVTSFQRTGLHRTLGELMDKQAIALRLAGGHLRYRHKTLEIGMTAMETRIGGNYIPQRASYLSNFPGQNTFAHYSLDFSYLQGRTVFFGELSSFAFHQYAQLLGLSAYLHPRLSFSLLFRHYPADYFPGFFAHPFAEKTATSNERGFYAGLHLLLHPKWSLSAYIDNFSFPFLRYRTDAPSHGHDYRLQLDFNANRHVKMYFRYRGKAGQINQNSAPEMLSTLIDQNKNSYRMHLDYSVNSSLAFANRFELVTLRKGDYYGTGYLLFQDVKWSPPGIPLGLNFRFAIFDTDSYDERIYAYEHDVLYAFSVPAYYDKGSRINMAVRYQLSRQWTLWFKLGHTHYSNKQTISSGLTAIQGNSKTDIRLQLRWKF